MLNALSALLVVLFGVFFFKSLIGGKSDYQSKMEAAKRKAAEYKSRAQAQTQARTQKRAQATQRARENEAAEDMRQCAVCEAWVPAQAATNCGKDGCPY